MHVQSYPYHSNLNTHVQGVSKRSELTPCNDSNSSIITRDDVGHHWSYVVDTA